MELFFLNIDTNFLNCSIKQERTPGETCIFALNGKP